MDELRKRLAERADAAMLSALYGTSNVQTTATATEPFTAAKLQAMMAKVPKPEVWLSTRLFPSEHALTVEGGTERFTVAGPGFWSRLADHLRKSEDVKVSFGPPTMFSLNLTPIEIDPWPEDSQETAKWRAAHWDRLREAMEVAMVPLPDWLRSPPTFGKHG